MSFVRILAGGLIVWVLGELFDYAEEKWREYKKQKAEEIVRGKITDWSVGLVIELAVIGILFLLAWIFSEYSIAIWAGRLLFVYLVLRTLYRSIIFALEIGEYLNKLRLLSALGVSIFEIVTSPEIFLLLLLAVGVWLGRGILYLELGYWEMLGDFIWDLLRFWTWFS